MSKTGCLVLAGLFIAGVAVLSVVQNKQNPPQAAATSPAVEAALELQRFRDQLNDAGWVQRNPRQSTCMRKHPGWGKACELIGNKQITEGFSGEQVVCSWGEPEKKLAMVTGGKRGECWFYHGRRVYFVNDGVVMIEETTKGDVTQ